MTTERWNQLQSLFEASLEQAPAELEEFLAKACPDDASLRQEVKDLVDVSKRSGTYFTDLARRAGVPASDKPASLQGKQIGRYRLIDYLGGGGMGTVYRAERIDADFHQRVALKLLPLGMHTEAARHRFLSERRILSRLDHPCIAQLLDGGVTDDGTPYFVMPCIEGSPLTTFCDAQGLPLEARLALFLQVCGAVQYAHRNLIVHRDLKPSNILVTDEGRVMLLDFGIAKLLDDEADAEGSPTTLTRRDGAPMTPAYAAPEQLRGKPVTTATDVYALGVVLYELLTGMHPFAHPGRTMLELQQAVCEDEPAAPSRAGNLRRLRGDLDTIVLTALQKDPGRRYASVDQLAEDLRRHLHGRPIKARKDTPRYLASRFVRRHRFGVAVSTVVGVLLIAVSILAVNYALTTARQSRVIAQERDRAEEISHYLQDLFRSFGPGENPEYVEVAQTVLDQGVSKARSELNAQPEMQAALLEVIGGLYIDLGLFETAEPVLMEARELQLAVFGSDHPELAGSLSSLGLLYWKMGRFEKAESFYRRAVALRRGIARERPLDLARSLNGLAVLLHDMGALDEAEQLHREALELRQNHLSEDDPQTIRSLHNLAAVLRDRSEFEAAEDIFNVVLERLRRRHGESHPDVATSLHNLAFLHVRTGNPETAETLHRKALEIRSATLGPNHPGTAFSLHSLATLLRQRGALEEAAAYYRQSLSIQRIALQKRHPRTSLTIAGLGTLLLEQEHAAAASTLLEEALSIQKEALSEDHWRTALTAARLGACLTALHRYAEAEALLLPSYESLRAQLGDQDARTAQARRHLIQLYEAWGKPHDGLLATIHSAGSSPD